MSLGKHNPKRDLRGLERSSEEPHRCRLVYPLINTTHLFLVKNISTVIVRCSRRERDSPVEILQSTSPLSRSLVEGRDGSEDTASGGGGEGGNGRLSLRLTRRNQELFNTLFVFIVFSSTTKSTQVHFTGRQLWPCLT